MLDVHGTASEEIAGELLHMGDDLLIAIRLGIALAPAVDAGVSVELDETEIFGDARVDEKRGDPGDFQKTPPLWHGPMTGCTYDLSHDTWWTDTTWWTDKTISLV